MRPRLVEISDSDFLESFCLDLLVHKLTFADGSIEGSHEGIAVSDSVGVLTTTSEGDENVTISGGADCFDCAGGECVEHN